MQLGKNETKQLLFPSGSERVCDVKVEPSLPKDYRIFFSSFEGWGWGIGLHAFLVNLSNNAASPSLEQLFPVQPTLFLPLPLHRGKRSPDDVWAQH